MSSNKFMRRCLREAKNIAKGYGLQAALLPAIGQCGHWKIRVYGRKGGRKTPVSFSPKNEGRAFKASCSDVRRMCRVVVSM